MIPADVLRSIANDARLLADWMDRVAKALGPSPFGSVDLDALADLRAAHERGDLTARLLGHLPIGESVPLWQERQRARSAVRRAMERIASPVELDRGWRNIKRAAIPRPPKSRDTAARDLPEPPEPRLRDVAHGQHAPHGPTPAGVMLAAA